MAGPGGESCEGCRFRSGILSLNADGKWHPVSRDEGMTEAEYEETDPSGECRRFPPIDEDGNFPGVYLTDWCGEFRPRDK